MQGAFSDRLDGESLGDFAGALLHIVVGLAMLILAAIGLAIEVADLARWPAVVCRLIAIYDSRSTSHFDHYSISVCRIGM